MINYMYRKIFSGFLFNYLNKNEKTVIWWNITLGVHTLPSRGGALHLLWWFTQRRECIEEDGGAQHRNNMTKLWTSSSSRSSFHHPRDPTSSQRRAALPRFRKMGDPVIDYTARLQQQVTGLLLGSWITLVNWLNLCVRAAVRQLAAHRVTQAKQRRTALKTLSFKNISICH